MVVKIGLLLALLLSLPSFAAKEKKEKVKEKEKEVEAEGFHVIKSVNLAGDSRWDLLTVDAPAKRLYVTRGSYVSVIDTGTLTEIGQIPHTNGVRTVALAPDIGLGFAS